MGRQGAASGRRAARGDRLNSGPVKRPAALTPRMGDGFLLDRRQMLLGAGGAGLALLPGASTASVQLPSSGLVIPVTDFGARSGSRADSTRAIQAAIDEVQHRGGGTVLIPGRFRSGNLTISGRGVRLQGVDGTLVDARITVAPSADGLEVADLAILETRGDKEAFPVNIAGRNCSFRNVSLVKDPPASGYQMYIRQTASGCRFDGLRLKGSNGIFVSGHDHSFSNFEIDGAFGDDAFAIKAVEAPTYNIDIRNGVVRGLAAIVSFGSEIGTPGRPSNYVGLVRNVTVANVSAERCAGVAFFKPGALDYDWRNGLVEGVRLGNLTLSDPTGEMFLSGIRMIAARGAIIRDVVASGIRIRARAASRGVRPTSAVDLTLLDIGAPARIEDVSLDVDFADPLAGAPHGPSAPGYPIDHVVRIEKIDVRNGSMAGITLDVQGHGAGSGGAYVGAGLDDAITLRRAILTRVATDPPAALGNAGIWSDSRLNLGEVRVDSVKLPDFAGKAMGARPR